jgi:hypothetical protein
MVGMLKTVRGIGKNMKGGSHEISSSSSFKNSSSSRCPAS